MEATSFNEFCYEEYKEWKVCDICALHLEYRV